MYSEEQRQQIFDDICELIISGKSLRFALNKVSIPAKTFFVWLRESEVLGKQYARATTERAELMFEDMFDIADEEPKQMESKFGTCVDTGDIQYKRVRIDTRKWALSKMMPKKYGDKPIEDDKKDTEPLEVVDFSYKELSDENQ